MKACANSLRQQRDGPRGAFALTLLLVLLALAAP